MGYDLSRGRCRVDGPNYFDSLHADDPGYSANVTGWQWLLHTASEHGWEHAGTLPPLGRRSRTKWSGTYCTNDGQRVTAKDASAWADALERGKPYSGESERWQKLVDDFIAYCRGGGFEID